MPDVPAPDALPPVDPTRALRPVAAQLLGDLLVGLLLAAGRKLLRARKR